MDGYDYLAGFLLFFLFFIYIVWFGFTVKEENQKEKGDNIKLNPYDNIPVSYTHLTLPTKRIV